MIPIPKINIGFRPYMSLMEPMYELVKNVSVLDIISSNATLCWASADAISHAGGLTSLLPVVAVSVEVVVVAL